MIPLLISILALILTIILYHNRIGQLLIRFVIILFFYLLIINFSLKIKTKITPTPPVLLIDVSPSIRSSLPQINQTIGALHFKHQKLFFSDTVYSKQEGLIGRFTNITNALITARNLSPSAIILISDGNHNSGPSPIELLNDFKVPVYCFGVGNKKLKDQTIVNVLYPRYTFYNDTVSVEVNIDAAGINKIGTISLKGDKIYREKTFKMTESPSRHTVDFHFVPKKLGNNRFRVSLTPQPEEIDYNNNTYDFSIDVFERKLSLFYYTDHPSANAAFITNYLKNDINLELTQAIKVSEDKFITRGKIISNKNFDLKQYHIIIFDNINSRDIPQNIKELLNKGKGILISGIILGTNEALNEILPFRVSGNQLQQELPVKVLLPFSILSPAENYAPVSRINLVSGINPQTVLIARAGEYPLIGYRKIGQGVIFQINIADLGVWHFAQSNLNHRDILTPLLEKIIRLLSPLGRNERLILESAKQKYHLGEKISLYLQSYDRNFMPSSGGDFYFELGHKKIPFFEIKPHFYETTFTAETIGEFTITAQGYLAGDTLKSNEIKFDIIEIPHESEEILNENLLEEIARRSGGSYHNLSELRGFQPPTTTEYYKTKTIPFDRPLLYFFICCLFILDWLIRKMQGKI
ncbi:MAG: vWA domain-containing protein [bacterium]